MVQVEELRWTAVGGDLQRPAALWQASVLEGSLGHSYLGGGQCCRRTNSRRCRWRNSRVAGPFGSHYVLCQIILVSLEWSSNACKGLSFAALLHVYVKVLCWIALVALATNETGRSHQATGNEQFRSVSPPLPQRLRLPQPPTPILVCLQHHIAVTSAAASRWTPRRPRPRPRPPSATARAPDALPVAARSASVTSAARHAVPALVAARAANGACASTFAPKTLAASTVRIRPWLGRGSGLPRSMRFSMSRRT